MDAPRRFKQIRMALPLAPLGATLGAMLGRLLLWAGILLGAALATPDEGRADTAQPQRIVAVGDLHGDYSAWMDIAHGAGLVDPGNHWTGGKTVLVQLGDIADRGPDSLKIIRSLQQLQREAPRAGGRVVVVLGNHEAMNLIGDFRYTTAGEYAAFTDAGSATRRDRTYEVNRKAIEAAYHAKDPKLSVDAIRGAWMAQTPLGWLEHKAAWSPSGELGRWAKRNPAVAKVASTLFVHGGLSTEYAKLPLEQINGRVEVAMATADDRPNSILTDPLGPLWYRGLAGADPDARAARTAARAPIPTLDQELDAVLHAYGARRVVIGHTPFVSGISITPDARLARIDTGISRYYGGPVSWLEILGDRMVPHTVRRSGQ